MPEGDQVPARQRQASDARVRLERIERALVELKSERLPADAGSVQLAERLVILEGQVNYHARMSRLTAIMLAAILGVIPGVGGFLMWQIGRQIDALVADRLETSKLLQAMSADRGEMLSILRGLNAKGSLGSITAEDMERVRGLLGGILGEESGGMLKNIEMQQQLLNELEAGSGNRRRPGR